MKLLELIKFDTSNFLQEEYDLLIGVDEVGRGSLAGPVVCAAFSSEQLCCIEFQDKKKSKKAEKIFIESVLKTRPILKKLDDSKKVKTQDRELLVNSLKDELYSTFYALAEKSADYIDEQGIVKAVFSAMSEAIAKIINQFYEVNQYYPKNILVLVDGPKTIPALEEYIEEYLFSETSTEKTSLKIDKSNSDPKIVIKQIAIKKGDSLSAAIAAASNIAKDFRDKLMKNIIKNEPQLSIYGWQTNVGYGSLAHCRAIQKHHLSIYHRRSFCEGILSNQS
jgi:ribonuclease HII